MSENSTESFVTDAAGNNNTASSQFNWTYTLSASAPNINVSLDYSTVYQTVDGFGGGFKRRT